MVIPDDFRQQMGSSPSKTTKNLRGYGQREQSKGRGRSWREHVTGSPVIYASASKREAAGQSCSCPHSCSVAVTPAGGLPPSLSPSHASAPGSLCPHPAGK